MQVAVCPLHVYTPAHVHCHAFDYIQGATRLWVCCSSSNLVLVVFCVVMCLFPHRGYQAVGVLLIFYSAPLSALAEVLRSRSSATLYWPLSVMSCVNGSLWVAYGLVSTHTHTHTHTHEHITTCRCHGNAWS